MYNTTAFLYEQIAGFKDPASVCGKVNELLARFGVTPPGHLGDFGAGTGLISIPMAEQGWTVYGVEHSAAMIAIGQEKTRSLSAGTQARLHWRQADITTMTPTMFSSSPEADAGAKIQLNAAICLHNTLNHLSEWAQVEGFIRAAHATLKPGGVLLLDTDTRATFEEFFNHPPTVVFDDDQHRITRACAFNPETGRAQHTAIVERKHEDKWTTLSQESMVLQHHDEQQLHAAFTAGGFEFLCAEPYNPSPWLYPEGSIPKVLWGFRKSV